MDRGAWRATVHRVAQSQATSYLDSAMRHLAKYMSGCDDEDHLAAAAFNVLGAMLVEQSTPDMVDIPMRYGRNTFNYFKEDKKSND